MTSLQKFLSTEHLLKRAGEKVYQRGYDYHADGQVRLDHHFTTAAIGVVMGTQPYRVELQLVDSALDADCTCPAMLDYGFCKHAVAMGLCIIEAAPPLLGEPPAPQSDHFTETYPNLALWIKDGWIEIGRDQYSTSVIRLLDEGGLAWEGGTQHKSIDRMLREADEAIVALFGDEEDM